MKSISATKARERLYHLLDETAESHEPVLVTGKRSNAVIMSEDDWRSIQETLYVLTIPGMRESIREGLDTPIEEADQKPDW
jgi:prevent-host-death family protein